MVKRVVKRKIGSGPSVLDLDDWINCYQTFGNFRTSLRQTLADFIKHICVNEEEIKDNKSSLEPTACRVVSLAENPVLRTIEVEEVLRTFSREVLVSVVRNDATTAINNPQLCRGKDTMREAAINLKHDILISNETENNFTFDAVKAYNSLNSQVFLTNILITS